MAHGPARSRQVATADFPYWSWSSTERRTTDQSSPGAGLSPASSERCRRRRAPRRPPRERPTTSRAATDRTHREPSTRPSRASPWGGDLTLQDYERLRRATLTITHSTTSTMIATITPVGTPPSLCRPRCRLFPPPWSASLTNGEPRDQAFRGCARDRPRRLTMAAVRAILVDLRARREGVRAARECIGFPHRKSEPVTPAVTSAAQVATGSTQIGLPCPRTRSAYEPESALPLYSPPRPDNVTNTHLHPPREGGMINSGQEAHCSDVRKCAISLVRPSFGDTRRSLPAKFDTVPQARRKRLPGTIRHFLTYAQT